MGCETDGVSASDDGTVGRVSGKVLRRVGFNGNPRQWINNIPIRHPDTAASTTATAASSSSYVIYKNATPAESRGFATYQVVAITDTGFFPAGRATASATSLPKGAFNAGAKEAVFS